MYNPQNYANYVRMELNYIMLMLNYIICVRQKFLHCFSKRKKQKNSLHIGFIAIKATENVPIRITKGQLQ